MFYPYEVRKMSRLFHSPDIDDMAEALADGAHDDNGPDGGPESGGTAARPPIAPAAMRQRRSEAHLR
jgi:hypothetical protein